MICDKIKFKNKNLICDIRLLKIIKINNIEDIKHILKSKSFSLINFFDNNSKIDYLEIKMKSTQKLKTKSLSLSLSLFEKYTKIYKISKILKKFR